LRPGRWSGANAADGLESWNGFQSNINEALVRSTTDAMVANGMNAKEAYTRMHDALAGGLRKYISVSVLKYEIVLASMDAFQSNSHHSAPMLCITRC